MTVKFKAPNASFPQAAATSGMGIVAPSTLAVPFEDRATGNLVGTGPFTLGVVHPGLRGRAASSAPATSGRRPTGRTPATPTSTRSSSRSSPRPACAPAACSPARSTAIGGVPPQDIDTLRDGDFQIVARPNPGVTFGITPVQDHAPLDDVRVRQAIAAAIDTTDVRDTVLSDDFAVAKSVLSQTTPELRRPSPELIAFDDAEGRPACSTRPAGPSGSDGVREKDGKKLHLVLGWLNNFGPNQAALELIQAQLAEAGIDIELKSTTGPEFTQGLGQPARSTSCGATSAGPTATCCARSFSTAGTNYYKVNDPELEPLLQQQAATADPDARDAILAQAQSRIVGQADADPGVRADHRARARRQGPRRHASAPTPASTS